MRAGLIVVGVLLCVLAPCLLAGSCAVMMGDHPPAPTRAENDVLEQLRGQRFAVLFFLAAGSIGASVYCFKLASKQR